MSDSAVREQLEEWARRPVGYARLLELAERFREILAKPQPIDGDVAALMKLFLHHVKELESVDDKDRVIELAGRCGQIRAEIALRYGVDAETDVRRDHLIAKARRFSQRNTAAANQRRKRDSRNARTSIIAWARDELARGNGRFRTSRRINLSELAKLCEGAAPHLTVRRRRHIIMCAIQSGELAERPTKRPKSTD